MRGDCLQVRWAYVDAVHLSMRALGITPQSCEVHSSYVARDVKYKNFPYLQTCFIQASFQTRLFRFCSWCFRRVVHPNTSSSGRSLSIHSIFCIASVSYANKIRVIQSLGILFDGSLYRPIPLSIYGFSVIKMVLDFIPCIINK